MPEINQYKFKHSELLNQCKRSTHRDFKKMLWLKRKLAQDEEQDRENKSKRESKRAANGFIVFLKQEYTKLVKENPEKTERNQCHAGREVEVHQ